MSIKLKDIYFGRADGLQESEEENFESLFYKGNQKYNLLCENQTKFIISGKKGTGKTILAKYFEKEQNKVGVPTKTLTKREFVLRTLIEKGELNIKNYEYHLFTEYVILIEIGKIILKNKKKLFAIKNLLHYKKIIGKLKYLNKIVKERVSIENFEKTDYRTQSGIKQSTSLTGKIKNKRSESSIGNKMTVSTESTDQYRKSPYYNLLDELKDETFFLMQFLSVNVIFDDLDELDEKVDENNSLIYCLISFIESASNLNVELKRNNIKNSRIIILIRTDIIKILNNYSSNLNKIVADSEIKLNWIKKTSNTEIHPLFDMILTKIQNSNEALKNKTKDEILRQFFPLTVNGVPVIDHMLNMSFGRPRDIITMLNIIKDEFPEKTYFAAECYKATTQEYSKKFLDELRNELSTHFEAKVIEECITIIRYINKKSFELADVETVFSEHKDDISCFNSEKDFLEFAYLYGIIGNTWKIQDEQNGSKYNFSWKYREDGNDKPDFSKSFYLHLALRKSLLG